MKFFYYISIFSLLFFFTKASATPLILLEDLGPGDFSTEVVDLQNFYNKNVDTVLTPSKVGEFGIETINATARFQNKFQRTILSPFRRLATGEVGVMTRFKIATIGIEEEPLSLKDVGVRTKLATLLNQTLVFLDQEIERRKNGSSVEGKDMFRGLKLPDAVARRVPGSYEINDRQGFYVDNNKKGFYYEFPETVSKPPDQIVTFDDAFKNYEYIQEFLSNDPVLIPLDDEEATVNNSNAFAPVSSGSNSNTTQTASAAVSLTPAEVSTLSSTKSSVELRDSILALAKTYPEAFNPPVSEVPFGGLPIVVATNKYGHTVGDELIIYGRGLLANSQVEIAQNGNTVVLQTRYVSGTELRVSLPGTLTSGRAVVGLNGSPYSAVEIFVFNPSTCVKERRGSRTSKCYGVESNGISESVVVLDTEMTITGRNFTASNIVETSTGIYYNVPSTDGVSLKLNIAYPFVALSEGLSDNKFPLGVKVLNTNGISDFEEKTAEFKKEISIAAQKRNKINKDGRQAENLLLTEYLESKGQTLESRVLEGLSQKNRSAISKEAFDSIRNSTEGRLAEAQNSDEGFFKKIYNFVSRNVDKALVAVGLKKETFASTLPHGGYITASMPCPCSGNWWVFSLGVKGGAYVYQPGYSWLWAYYNIITPGTPILGSWTPGAGQCWIYAGVTCAYVPALGAFDLFPGTGTGLI